MKKTGLVLGLIAFLSAGFIGLASAQVGGRGNINSKGLDAFHSAIGDYFKVSTQQVQACEDSSIPTEEQPVVFFIAQRANVSPESVILLRSRGTSWMQIALHYNINPRVFYTQGDYTGTTFENGSRAFRNKRINLSDSDVVNFVNLKFTSEHYGREPKEIAKMRTGGTDFVSINQNLSKKQGGVKWDAKEPTRRTNRSVVNQGNDQRSNDKRDNGPRNGDRH
jgi:hypothetical protein